MKRILIVGIILLTSSLGFELRGQDNCPYSLQGQIFDAVSKEPIPYATVRVLNTTQGVVSDDQGRFYLKGLCQAEYVLEVSHVGYKKTAHHHDPGHSNPLIYLAPDDQVLESIVVEGEAISGQLETITTTSLSQQALRTRQSESLGDVLGQISGVNTISTGQNVVKPVIHGLHSNRILIINNGLRHEFQNWGTDHAPEIDPSLVDKIQVIKGAAAVPYGPDALGGVVLIDQEEIELSSHLHGEARLTGKSNGRSGEGTMYLQKGFKHFGLMGRGSWLKQGDLHAPEYQLTNTGKNETSYAAGLRVHPVHFLDMSAYYSHFDQELGVLRGGVNGNLDDLLIALESPIPNETKPFSYNINTPKQEITHDLFKALMTYIDDHQSLSVRYGRQFNHRKEFDVRRGNDLETPNINLELLTNTLDIDWAHPKIGPLQGKVGFQWLKQDNQNIPGTNTIPFVPNYQTERVGYYLIESMELGDNTYELGVRFDTQHSTIAGRDRQNDVYRDELDFENFTASLGWIRRLNHKSTWRTNLGTAWRPPNIAELYRFGRHLTFIEYGLWRYQYTEAGQVTTRDVLTQEDKPITPEKGYKWISSYNYSHDKLQLEITGFVNYIENFIYTRPAGITTTVRGTSPYFIYDQADALLWGVDMSAQMVHTERFTSDLSASYLWSRQVSPKDYFAGQPPANASYALTYSPKIPFFTTTALSLELDYTFRQYQAPRVLTVEEILDAGRNSEDLFINQPDFDILPPPPGYLLTHLNWRSSIKQFELQLRVTNLFNVRYRNYTDRLRYFADDLGRNFTLSLSYRL